MASSVVRKIPLSTALRHYQSPGCYVNLWFEHEIDVPADSIRLLHFVRHPVKWVRSAYLYHKKGAPSDLIRWVDWRVFVLRDKQLSYSEVLNRVDSATGLAIEAIRSFPEIIATARVARTSARLKYRQLLSLEQVHESFDATIARFCIFIGFEQSEAEKMLGKLKHLDLSQPRAEPLPDNVTRTSPEGPGLERILARDSSFSKLYADAAQDMGFRLSDEPPEAGLILPEAIVTELLEGRACFGEDWQTAERTREFMQRQDAAKWWPTYVLQVPGSGHLMMHGFIQQLLGAVR